MNREQLEKALKESEEKVSRLTQQLADANKELEMLSYSISHDLRAPLRAIKGFSEALLEDYKTKLDEDGRRYLDIIVGGSKQIGKLIEGVLNYSRLGRQEMQFSEVNMAELVRAMGIEFQAKFPARKIDFRFHPMPNANGDFILLRYVWAVLMDNAVKFTAPREPALIELTGRSEPGENVYEIKDNGVGFDMKYAEKLFGVFQRFHSEKDFEGAGIGLAIAQRLVRRHNGRMWADSKVGEGSTFRFALPNNDKSVLE
jgi:light-regulated signal transduction histidine kinase (bacteriophytochrome)